MAPLTALEKLAKIDTDIAFYNEKIDKLDAKKKRHHFGAICELLDVPGELSRVLVINKARRDSPSRFNIYTIHPSKRYGAMLKPVQHVWGSASEFPLSYETMASGLYDGKMYEQVVAATPEDSLDRPDAWTRLDITPEMDAAAGREFDPRYGKVRTHAWAEIKDGERLYFTGKMGLIRQNNLEEAEARIRQVYPEIGRIDWVSTCEYEVNFPGVAIPK